MDKEQERKLAELRALIDEGDRDIAEGRVKNYSRGELAAEAIARGRMRLNLSTQPEQKPTEHPQTSVKNTDASNDATRQAYRVEDLPKEWAEAIARAEPGPDSVAAQADLDRRDRS